MESGGSGKTMGVILLIVGLLVGFGAGYMVPALVTADDYVVIMSRGEIIVGTNSGWPPFEMVNTTDNSLIGFDIDLAEMVAEYMGVTIDWVDMGFEALVGACQAGTIDMIASATFITPERCAVLEPVCWYIRTNEVMVVKGDSAITADELEDFAGMDVGVQTGTTEDEAASNATLGIDVHRYPLVETMFQDLDSGALDAIFVDEPIVGLYSTVYDVKIIFARLAPPTAFYIRYGSHRLSAAVNSAIADGFADGTVDALISKWFG